MTTSLQRLFLLLLAMLAAGTGIAQAADTLVVYSGRSDKFVKPVAKAFTQQTGVNVILHNAKSTALLNKLRLEGKRTDADLYLSNDAGNLQKGSDMGLFSPMPTDLSKDIPANFRSENNDWVGLSARARVLVVNTDSPAAKQINSVLDLAKPRFKDKIGITNSANESFIAGVTVYVEKMGEKATADWLKGLRENAGRNIFNKHSKIVKAVAKGKIDVGLVNHYYIYRHLAKDAQAPIDILLPDQGKEQMGIAWNVAGVAISKHSNKQKLAQRFVHFLTSEAGQKLFAEVNREYPTRTGIPAAVEIPNAEFIKVADVPMSTLGKKRDATLDLLQAVDMP